MRNDGTWVWGELWLRLLTSHHGKLPRGALIEGIERLG